MAQRMNLMGLLTVYLIERAAPPRVRRQFGQHHPRKVSRSLKVLAVLTASWPVMESTTKRISPGLTAFLMASTFLHHGLVDGQAARRIDDDDILVLALRLPDGIRGDLDGILAPVLAVHVDPDLSSQYFQLLHGRRTVNIRSRNKGEAPCGSSGNGPACR